MVTVRCCAIAARKLQRKRAFETKRKNTGTCTVPPHIDASTAPHNLAPLSAIEDRPNHSSPHAYSS